MKLLYTSILLMILWVDLYKTLKEYFIQVSGMSPTYFPYEQIQSMLAPIRVFLSETMVTTYTYDPLIGVTSITDPQGLTTYYNYDDFGRLESVKDTAGNLLSTNEYHYQP